MRNRRVAWLWPASFFAVLVGWLFVGDGPGDILAAVGFGTAGGLCLANAARCRRVHCIVTGPLYLVAAVLFLVRAGAAIPVTWIIAGSVVGTVLAMVPEWFGKRYFAAP